MKSFVLLLLSLASAASAQWFQPITVGRAAASVPVSADCAVEGHYGRTWVQSDVDPPVFWLCGSSGWSELGAGADFDDLALTGDVTSSGQTTTIGADKVRESMLKVVDSPADEEFLTYESITGDFEWQTGGVGDFVGPASSTDNAIVRFDGTTGKLGQNSDLAVSDVASTTVTVATSAGNAITLKATDAAAAAGASQAGKAAQLNASNAVASTDTAGAAAGGAVTITSGAAARLTSGNANGGAINLTPGAGIGTGIAGAVNLGTGPTVIVGGSATYDLQVSTAGVGLHKTLFENQTAGRGLLIDHTTNNAMTIGCNGSGCRTRFIGSADGTSNVNFQFPSDADSGLYSVVANEAYLVAGAVLALGVTATEVDHYVIVDDADQSVTCADNATPALASSVTITPTQGYIKYTNSDADGCAITLSETGATDGRTFEIVNVSNAGGVNTLADSAGVQETGAGCSMTVWGSARFRYATDRFIMSACQAVN